MQSFKLFALSVLLGLFSHSASFAQSYSSLWRQVDEAQSKGLPQSALSLTGQIFLKAQREQQAGQLFKACLRRDALQSSLTPDSLYACLDRLERWAQVEENPVHGALIHIVLACMYADYKEANAYRIHGRTEVALEEEPADVREWTVGMLDWRIARHIASALTGNRPALLEASAADYQPFAVLGADSRFFRHDLFHLLSSMALELYDSLGTDYAPEALALCDELRSIYAGNRYPQEAALKLALDALRRRDSVVVAHYDSLIARYASCPMVVEAYHGKALLLRDGGRPASALQACDEGLSKHPGYRRIGLLKNLRDDLLRPELTASAQQMHYPGDTLSLQVQYKNLQTFTARLYSTDYTEQPRDAHIDAALLQRHAREVGAFHFNLYPRPGAGRAAEDLPYLHSDTIVPIKLPQPAGVYILAVTAPQSGGRTKAHTSYSYLVISRFKVLTLDLGNGQTEVLTLDSQSGHPQGGVEVTFYKESAGRSSDRVLNRVVTDGQGRAVFSPQETGHTYYVARKGDDTGMLRQGIYFRGAPSRAAGSDSREAVTLLTDRSIYRPGQMVHIKGVAHRVLATGSRAEVVADKPYVVRLLDTQGKEMRSEAVRTNEFGSFSLSLSLPDVCLNGTYTISVEGGGSTHVRVEEYRRPAFEVVFNPLSEAYRLGDRVELTGSVRRFSGATVQRMPLAYRVTTAEGGWRVWRGQQPLMADTVWLDDSGRFAIPLDLAASRNISSPSPSHFDIEVSVTDEAGETQQASHRVDVSARAYQLLMDGLDDKVRKSAPHSYTPIVTNQQAARQNVEVRYRLFRLKSVHTPWDADLSSWTPVDEGVITSNNPHRFDAWAQLPTAFYRLSLSLPTEAGLAQEQRTVWQKDFWLYGDADRRLSTFADLFVGEPAAGYSPGRPTSLLLGTSHRDAYVWMDITRRGAWVESRVLRLSDELAEVEIPCKEAYGDEVTVSFTLVKAHQVHTGQVAIRKETAGHGLNMRWEVFRDKLLPGQSEEWRLVVLTPQGAPAEAEMLATLYDASLDKLYRRDQQLRAWLNTYTHTPARQPSGHGYADWSLRYFTPYTQVPSWRFDRLDIPRPAREESLFLGSGVKQMSLMRTAAMDGLVETRAKNGADLVYAEEKVAATDTTVEAAAAAASAPHEQGEAVPLRSDFSETAFFYPHLQSNERGEIVISFTMPESVTRWNFQGYAHTKDMHTGMLRGEAQTSKPFMVQPHIPRFARVGDRMQVAAMVANLSGEPVSGEVTFTVFNPLDGKTLTRKSKPFSTVAGGNARVVFDLQVDDGIQLLGLKMVADGGRFSDGEQHLLPVLSNKQRVVESLPMTVNGTDVRRFSTGQLFNKQHPDAGQRKLTVEFTGNPAWYAVQALPAISRPTTDNAVEWASALYANTLARVIAQSHPAIRNMVSARTQSAEGNDAWRSSLEKNSELRDILLRESPWMLEADNGTAAMQALSALFDANGMDDRLRAAVVKLQALQQADGGWGWFGGMGSSPRTTAHVLELLVRLQAHLSDGAGRQPMQQEVDRMKEKAFAYLHEVYALRYKELLRQVGKSRMPKRLQSDEVQYLYLVAVAQAAVPKSSADAYRHYLSLVPASLEQGSITEKARLAVALHHRGERAEAAKWVRSIREHLVTTEELGSHFAFSEPSLYGYVTPLTRHVAAMEALQTVGGNEESLEKMKVWLLKQKQVQGWNSPVATADAVYALLCRGENLLDSRSNVRVTLAREQWDAASGQSMAGADYWKQSFTGKKEVYAKEIIVEKQGDGLAWGAAYAQYFIDMARVEQAGNALQVERKLYVERTDAAGRKTLEPLDGRKPLSVGDVVVSRLTVRADRAMDYVQLRDRTAACLEPLAQLSGYRHGGGERYYMEVDDTAVSLFFDVMEKGTHLLEVRYRVAHSGRCRLGASTVQSAYAPEFSAHTAGGWVEVR